MNTDKIIGYGMITIIVIGILLLLMIFGALINSAMICANGPGKQANAENFARKMQLKNATVYCEPDYRTCSCSIAYDTDIGRKIETFACCGNGCGYHR
jgi:hypothetical protein